MKRFHALMLFTIMLMVATALSAHALTITAGEYRFVISQALTRINNPGAPAVAGRPFQGNQWAIARISSIQKRNANGVFVDYWTAGNTVPDPPAGNTDKYITAVVGGLALQKDPANPFPAANTGLGYNLRQHPQPPLPPQGTGLLHPNDYVNPNVGSSPFPHNSFFISDTLGVGTGYLKLFSTPTDVFADDAVIGPGIGGGAFGTFAPKTVAGKLLVDAVFDANALLAGDLSGDCLASTGAKGELRVVASSDVEGVILAFFQTTGSGAWDNLFNANHPNFFGADGQIDLTAKALNGSPYLPIPPGQSPDPEVAFGWDFRDAGQGLTAAIELNPCIEIEKQISVDGGDTWSDADTEAEAPAVTTPHDALYRIIIHNCGNVNLTNVVVNDSDLGISNYLVGNLPVGGTVTLNYNAAEPQLSKLLQAPRCREAGTFVNTACVTSNETPTAKCDPAYLVCTAPLPCRVTAGGNKDGITIPCALKSNGLPDPKSCAESGYDTWGGQAGAQPGIDGNWTHHHDPSPKDSFLFHSNNLFFIACSDPGCCVPACANADNRQIDFSGIGRINNVKGIFSKAPFNFTTGKDYCFMVHLEDIGEPGPGGRWPSATEPCTHCPATPIQPGDCVNCTDYYEIRVFDGAGHDGNGNCTGTPLYVNGPGAPENCGAGMPAIGGYFTRTGNVQMHPENN